MNNVSDWSGATGWANYHGHSCYCDGKQKPEQYVVAAINAEMKMIGFSSHAPLPLKTDWHMKAGQLPFYQREIDALKKKYYDKITVLTSLEVDYVPGLMGPAHENVQEAGLDYVVGSVHYVDAFDPENYWAIDNHISEFKLGLKRIFKNDIKKAVTRYFCLQQEMLENQPPHILGHMDKIKMFNHIAPFFDEEASWYKKAVYDTLSLAAEKGVVVEMNTKYCQRSGLFFPGPEHLKWMVQNNIPLTLSSDAHRPEALLTGFIEGADLLLAAGVRELWNYKNNSFVPMPFSREGILWK